LVFNLKTKETMELKYISKTFLCVALILSLGSCDKKLDLEPRQSVDASIALETVEDLEAAVVGCYSIMGGGALYGTNMFMLADLQASEDYLTWVGTFQGQREVALKSMTPQNTEANRTWIAAYAAINMANIVLSNLDIVEDDQAKRDQLEGEALFVRGILHFELVRYFALPWDATPGNDHPGVVIRTTETRTEEQAFERLPRSTVAAVYTQVINDLTAAIQKLPSDNGTRADSYTAMAFLARVYLQQGEYEQARDFADIILSATNDLGQPRYQVSSVNTAFTNKNSPATVWEIQQNEQNNAGSANDGLATFYASLVGIGRADVIIEIPFLQLYDPADSRLSEWYYVGVGAGSGMYTSKWNSFSQNLPVIRAAEIYLIRAETNARLGTAVGATPEADLAQIRNPARTNTLSIEDPTVDDILFERMLELAFEGARIHDIKRTQDATGGFSWNDQYLIFPIPQREVDATEGVIAQNPGY
jgi:starch-binding outer membrane protein, SusD/RagB family